MDLDARLNIFLKHLDVPQRRIVSALIEMYAVPESGGLPGLLQLIRANGLGEELLSWIDEGPNLPLKLEQIDQAFGTEKIDQLAYQAGMYREKILQEMTSILPKLIDAITPDGKLDGEVLFQSLRILRDTLRQPENNPA